ncbi:LytR C-terminal domain-containing protein [Nocardia sp. bgisy134]|uniref:LytR C-terminal domain-containing protein n=1 Tax=unclassified Nocardia TaxID=2637762 RepID=UPI003D748C64
MSQTNPTSGGPPLRALAMVLIALAIVFAGLGAMSLSSSDSDATNGEESSSATAAQQVTSAAPATTAAPTTVASATGAPTTTVASTTSAAPTTTAGAPAGTVDRAVPVRVLNNSLVAGLAARTANDLSAKGWTNVSSGNYAGGNIAKTTVYYGNTAGEREAAMVIAADLGATAEPKSAGVGDGSAGVIVILTGN